MGNNKMVQLQNATDHEILITLVDSQNGFDKELEENHCDPRLHDRMLNKLELMARCCNCESAPVNIMNFLRMVNKSALVHSGLLSNFVMDIGRNPEIDLSRYSAGMVNVLSLIKTFFIRMPNSDFVNRARLTLLATEQLIKSESPIVNDEAQILFIEIQSLVPEPKVNVNNTGNHPVEGAQADEDDGRAPPGDFREMSVVPNADDINRNEETFLRANKSQGRYEDLNHYLDVQFRLLREDFVQPLRNGIFSHQEVKNGGLPPGTKMTDIRIYEDVHILGPVCTGQGLAYRIQFDNSGTKKIKWEVSKRLIFGSLVALSFNDFATMYLCTVANRNPRDLAKGILEVQVEQDHDEFSQLGPDISFTMAETTAYFESYRHVLSALKEIRPEEFPFQRYLVRCNKTIGPPRYLQRHGEIKFDFRPLIPRSEDEAIAAERRRFRAVPVLDVEEWPSAEKLHLDDSQYEALKHCLTKEFALVQGPPGTGKTFLGLKVMQLLLHNWKEWNQAQNNRVRPDGDDNPEEPILVVCYTNHALDQFLEGMKKFTEKQIIRVGSRSQSEVLKDCSLNNIRSDMKRNRRVPITLHNATRRLGAEMHELQEDILTTTCIIECIENNIILLDKLAEVISEGHIHQLQEFYWSGRDDPIMAWLTEEPHFFQPQWNGQWQEDGGRMDDFANGLQVLQVDNFGGAMANEEEVYEEEVDEEEQRRILEEDSEKHETGKKTDENRKKIMQAVQQAFFVDQEEVIHAGAQNSQWETQGRKKKGKKRKQMFRMQKNVEPMPFEEVEGVVEIYNLPRQDRYRLYKYWKEAYKRVIRDKCRENEKVYHQKSLELNEARHQLDKSILQTAAVIGMTTTAAARYHLILQDIKPRLIIVEEAAEVLEAHVVTSLTRNCEHLILIGDHKQLRPSPNVFDLATRYHLDLSLFERMVNNGTPLQTLRLQHRMKPLISKLMKPIYSNLCDDDSVQAYPEVKGVGRSLYFMKHTHSEESQEDLSSKSNKFEAQYIQKLCKYLLLQDYDPSRITILTPYSGQMFQLKKFLKDTCKGVRITPVDNFQGEENDIIILSLVRSNKDGKLGFLKIENRVCVALSRAKIGLFVIGNIDFLASHSKIWLNMKTIAEREEVIGPALPLVCQNHPETKIDAALPKDFDEAPEGGCMLPCGTRLDCGHGCPRPCHSYDPQHENIKCEKPCAKFLCDEHRCPKKCSEPCGECMVLVQKKVPICNHEAFLPCHKDPSTWICKNPCGKKLSCGHDCVNNCGDICVKKCQVLVKKRLRCDHVCEMKCCDDPDTFPCTDPCGAMLKCGHQCQGTCSSCHKGRLHQGCKSPCNRTLICGHSCDAPCSEVCPPCKRKCETRCPHSSCKKACGELCTPCKEPCKWRCRHYKCTRLCSEPCDRPVCDKPCDKELTCGHPCIGLCGEICPKLCRICHKDIVTEIFFGDEDEDDAKFIVLDCLHIMEVTGMDKWMATGNETDDEIVLKSCPRCKTPIRKTLRYKTQVKTVLADIERVKERYLGDFNRATKANDMRDAFVELRGETDGLLAKRLLEYLEGNCVRPLNMEHYQEMEEERFIKVLRKLSFSLSEYASLENLMKFAITLEKIRKKLKDGASNYRLHGCEDVMDYFERLRRTLQTWLTNMVQSSSRLSQQQCAEFTQEVHRLQIMVKLCRVQSNLSKSCKQKELDAGKTAEANGAFKILDNLLRILKSNKPYNDERRQKCESSLKAVADRFPGGGLGISKDEQVEIVTALGLGKGHWYKCPNGHLYVITECGGATTEGKCNECGAPIGGGGHRLRGDNRLASEMDGATEPAWPTALQ